MGAGAAQAASANITNKIAKVLLNERIKFVEFRAVKQFSLLVYLKYYSLLTPLLIDGNGPDRVFRTR